jgi:hypothetical protein
MAQNATGVPLLQALRARTFVALDVVLFISIVLSWCGEIAAHPSRTSRKRGQTRQRQPPGWKNSGLVRAIGDSEGRNLLPVTR